MMVMEMNRFLFIQHGFNLEVYPTAVWNYPTKTFEEIAKLCRDPPKFSQAENYEMEVWIKGNS